MRSVENWQKHMEGKTPYQISQMILSDMLGYRSTSLKRSEDEDNLTNAVRALMKPKT
jgi:hypothetical protein